MSKLRRLNKSGKPNNAEVALPPITNLALSKVTGPKRVAVSFEGGGSRYVTIWDEDGSLVAGANRVTGATFDLPYGGRFRAVSDGLLSSWVLVEHDLPANIIYSLEGIDIRASYNLVPGANSNTKYRFTIAGVSEEVAYNLNSKLLAHNFGGNRWQAGDVVEVSLVVRHYDGANFIDSVASVVNIQIPGLEPLERPLEFRAVLTNPSLISLSNSNSLGKPSVEVQFSENAGAFTGSSIIDNSPATTEVGPTSALGQQIPSTEGVYDAGTYYFQARFIDGNRVSEWTLTSLIIEGADLTPPDPPANPVLSWNTGTSTFTLAHDASVDAVSYRKEIRKQGDTQWFLVDQSSSLSVTLTEAQFNQLYPQPLTNGTYEARYQAVDAAGNWSTFATATVAISSLTPDLPALSGVTASLESPDTLLITYGAFGAGADRIAFQVGRSDGAGGISWGLIRYDASAPEIIIGSASAAGLELEQSDGIYRNTLYWRVANATADAQGPWFNGTTAGASPPAFDLRSTMQTVTAGVAFDFQAFEALNGNSPVTWQVTGLPGGVNHLIVGINSRLRRLVGTIGVAGTYPLTITATDANGTPKQISVNLVVTAVPTQTGYTVYTSLVRKSGTKRVLALTVGNVQHVSTFGSTPNSIVLQGGNCYRLDTGAFIASVPNNGGSAPLFHKAPTLSLYGGPYGSVVYTYAGGLNECYLHPIGGTRVKLFDRNSVGAAYGRNVARLHMSSSEGRMLVGRDYGVAGIMIETNGNASVFFYKLQGGFTSRLEPLPGYPYNVPPENASDIDYFHCSILANPNSPASDPVYYMFLKPRPQSQNNATITGMVIPLSNAGAGVKFNVSHGEVYHGGPCIWRDSNGVNWPAHVDSAERVFNLVTGQRIINGIAGVDWRLAGHVSGHPNACYLAGDNTTTAIAAGNSTTGYINKLIGNTVSEAEIVATGLAGDAALLGFCMADGVNPQQMFYKKNGEAFLVQI